MEKRDLTDVLYEHYLTMREWSGGEIIRLNEKAERLGLTPISMVTFEQNVDGKVQRLSLEDVDRLVEGPA